jgi:hypothetical protein
MHANKCIFINMKKLFFFFQCNVFLLVFVVIFRLISISYLHLELFISIYLIMTILVLFLKKTFYFFLKIIIILKKFQNFIQIKRCYIFNKEKNNNSKNSKQ